MNSLDRALLIKIIEEAEELESFVSGLTLDAFLASPIIKKAVCMTLLNIGELAKNLTEDFVVSHQSVPWRLIMRFRDIVAHRYQSLDMSLVFTTATIEALRMQQQIKLLLQEE